MSKAYQLALKMIADGFINALNDPTYGPRLIAAMQERIAVPTGPALLTAVRDATVSNPAVANQIWNILMAHKIASGDSKRFSGSTEVGGALKPGDTMTLGTRTIAEVLTDPYPSPVDFEEPQILENLVTASALVGGGGGGGAPDVSITLTPPANRLVGQTYTASVNPPGSPIQWQLDGVDVSGQTATTFAPADPGRVTARSGAVVSNSVWARRGPTSTIRTNFAGGAAFSETIDIGADYPNKKAYALVMGYRSAGQASFNLTLNGSTSHRVASSIWDETSRWGHVYAVDDPGTSLDLSYAGTDIQFVEVMVTTAAGFAHDAATDFGFDSVVANDATTASVSITNDEHGLLIACSNLYQAFPQGPALIQAVTSDIHLLGEVLATANTERAITATRTGSAIGKRFIAASFAPLPDVAP